jgi:Glycosyltransferase
MKIALVSEQFLPRVGGVELHVADLGRQLAARGHCLQIVTATPGQSVYDGITVHRIAASLLPKYQITWNHRPMVRLRRILEQEAFDVIHTHSSVVTPLAYSSLYYASKMRLPCVLTSHSYFMAAAHIFRLLDVLFGWSQWPIVLTGVSGAIASELKRASKRDDIAVLPNGIDYTQWDIEPLETSELQVTSVMRLNAKKRPQDLIRAIPAILRKLPQDKLPKFIIAGDGPRRPALERLIERFGIQEHVQLLGFVSRENIRELFRKTTLFALPSRQEAFGIAVLEARCAGLPTVAMSGCGVAEMIEHGRQGYLAGDHQEFIHYITQIIRDNELRDRMAQEAKVNLEQFSWDTVIQNHLEVYAHARKSVRNMRGTGPSKSRIKFRWY